MKAKLSAQAGGPLIEIIIALCVFAIGGSIATYLFVGSNSIAQNSTDITIATMKAQSTAELIKSDQMKMGEHLIAAGFGAYEGSTTDDTYYCAYFDKDWNALSQTMDTSGAWTLEEDSSQAEYTITVSKEITYTSLGSLVDAKVSIEKIRAYPFFNKEGILNLISLTVSDYHPATGGAL